MTVFVGDILNATAAAVTSAATSTRTWQWLRSGSALSGFTGTSYRVLTGDAGSTLSIRQTETNFMGATSATSDPTATVGTWTPSTLFALSEPGVWYDADDYTAMFQDSAGTIPITGAGQPLGLLLDKSKGLVLGPELDDGLSTVVNWTVFGTNVVAQDGDAIKITYTASQSSQGAYQQLRQTKGLTTDLTVGKWYRVAGQAKVNSGSANIQVSTAATFNGPTITATSFVDFSFYFLCDNATTNYLSGGNLSTGEELWIRAISVKELPGNHATSSGDARPTTVIRPMDAERRNLLTRTEEFENAVWTKTNSSITANAVSAPDGTTTADKLVENTANSTHAVSQAFTTSASTSYTFTVYAKADTRSHLDLSALTGFTTNPIVRFTLSGSGASSVRQGSPTPTHSIQSVGDGWYRCQINVTTVAGGSSTFQVALATDASSSNFYTGDGTSGILIWGAQLEVASSATPYQKVVTTNEWYDPAVPSYRGIRFDGVDDSMVTPTITPGTDKAQVFAGVRKLSDAARGMLLETSSGAANGSLSVQAPNGAAANNYEFNSIGTSSRAAVGGGFVAPISSVLTGLADIAAPSVTLRVNGAQAAQSLFSQGTGNYLAYPLYIGRRGGSSLPFTGILTSLVVRFGANLSTSVINRAEYYVSEKTGFDLAKFTAPEIYARSGELVFDRFNATIERRAV